MGIVSNLPQRIDELVSNTDSSVHMRLLEQSGGEGSLLLATVQQAHIIKALKELITLQKEGNRLSRLASRANKKI